MIKVALVRGRYLNKYEGQNYLFNKKRIKLVGVSSFLPLHQSFPFPVIKLPSIADLQIIKLLDKPVKYLSNRWLGDSQILFGLERLANRFNIFHTADPHYYFSYQLAKLRSQNKIQRLISTSWETIPFNNESVHQKKLIKKFTQKKVDLFITYTKKAKISLVKEGVNENKIKIVRLGVDLNRFKYQISKIKNQNDNSKIKKKRVLFVGRPVWEKGLNDLKKAIKYLGDRSIELKIVKAGSVDYQKMPKIYQQSDIVVMPSKTTSTWEEQYGMVLIEAMASGLPIIAYNSGVIPEILDKAGILIKEGNINSLAKAIKRLSDDKNLRQKLGRISRERAEKYFDAKKTAAELAKIYENLSYHSLRRKK